MNYFIFFQNVILAIIITIFLKFFENKSNFSDYIMIPLISTLIIKYSIGDYDIGYVWTESDILFWTGLPFVSIITVFLIKNKNLCC